MLIIDVHKTMNGAIDMNIESIGQYVFVWGVFFFKFAVVAISLIVFVLIVLFLAYTFVVNWRRRVWANDRREVISARRLSDPDQRALRRIIFPDNDEIEKG